MLFRKYKEKIAVLEEQLKSKDGEIKKLEDRNDELRRLLNGERVESPFCRKCEHAVSDGWSVLCSLGVRCKDFERKMK